MNAPVSDGNLMIAYNKYGVDLIARTFPFLEGPKHLPKQFLNKFIYFCLLQRMHSMFNNSGSWFQGKQVICLPHSPQRCHRLLVVYAAGLGSPHKHLSCLKPLEDFLHLRKLEGVAHWEPSKCRLPVQTCKVQSVSKKKFFICTKT